MRRSISEKVKALEIGISRICFAKMAKLYFSELLFTNWCPKYWFLLPLGRKRFAHLSDIQDEIHVEENVPWGEDTLFTLEFREEANKYAIHTCNNMYLQKDGKLVPSVNKVKCPFFVQFWSGRLFVSLFESMIYALKIGVYIFFANRSSSFKLNVSL